MKPIHCNEQGAIAHLKCAGRHSFSLHVIKEKAFMVSFLGIFLVPEGYFCLQLIPKQNWMEFILAERFIKIETCKTLDISTLTII